jgi:protein-S-isoprenylcysteine O-methyltransferase Ste14
MTASYIFLSLFTISEVTLLLSRRSRKAKAKNQDDGQSLLYLWIIITVCMTTGYVAALRHIWMFDSPTFSELLGVIIVITGFIFRWIAIFQLGALFTVDVSISIHHSLKVDGLYRLVRHPTYWGLLLIISGSAVLMGSALSCMVVVIPIFLVINYRIWIEEKSLIREFGSQYLAYKKKVRKIIPLVY